ncbi:MAG: YqgE/AlgH family protein [Pseudomonadota bacterium]
MNESDSLTNQFLIAMPALGDPNFFHTVTLICEHTDEGALGLIINRPLDIRVSDIFSQMARGDDDGDENGDAGDEDVDSDSEARPAITIENDQHVLLGGPVHQERGFVLHRPFGDWDNTLRLSDTLGLTTSRDILDAIATGNGPDDELIALGCAGWGAGQLEQELSENAWLSVPATEELIFETPFDDRWAASARLLGVDLNSLSREAGHA